MPDNGKPTIGILALQGAFDAHARMLQSIGAKTQLVRKPSQLAEIDGLVIPRGESSTFLKHLELAGFFAALEPSPMVTTLLSVRQESAARL